MSRTQPIGWIEAVLIGKAVPYTRPGSRSAIANSALSIPAWVSPTGLEGDEQGGRRVHRGPDKAVHCYAWSHDRDWFQELAGCSLLRHPGAFGENFSIDGLAENEVCLGDRWQVGSAVVEVSQGRQPCWKLTDRFGVPNMARRVQDTLRADWHLRVIEPGHVRQGDAIVLLDRP